MLLPSSCLSLLAIRSFNDANLQKIMAASIQGFHIPGFDRFDHECYGQPMDIDMLEVENLSQPDSPVVDLTTNSYDVQVLQNPQSPCAYVEVFQDAQTPRSEPGFPCEHKTSAYVEVFQDAQTPRFDFESPCAHGTLTSHKVQVAQSPPAFGNQTQESPAGGAIMSPSHTIKVAKTITDHDLATLRTIPKSWDAASFGSPVSNDFVSETIIDSPGSETVVDPLSPDPTCMDQNVDFDGLSSTASMENNPEEERPPL